MELDFNWAGFNQLDQMFYALGNFDPMPVLDQWDQIIVEGNRRGVLSGVDGHGVAAPPLQYRDGRGKKTRNRKAPNFGTTTFQLDDAGPFTALPNDNLTTAQYRKLTGPRLAPRGELSRSIKALGTIIESVSDDTWRVVGSWEAFSVKGVKFLPFHFDGDGNLPKYDLRPVRPEDLEFCGNALRGYLQTLMRARA